MENTVYDVFTSIFGEYEPIVTTVGDTTLTDMNWAYIGSVVCFIVLLYCGLRMIASVLCKDMR